MIISPMSILFALTLSLQQPCPVAVPSHPIGKGCPKQKQMLAVATQPLDVRSVSRNG